MGLNMDLSNNITTLIITFPLFLVALTAHEFAHGYVAYLEGDPTAKYAGRLTLNPIDHLDPVGTLCFIISSLTGFGFGWAKPVPVNPLNYRRYRTGDILVSLAGVTANLLLIVITAIVIKLLVISHILSSGDFWVYKQATLNQYIAFLLWWFMDINAVLIVLNLLPIPPLDGSHVLMRLLPARQAESFARIGPYGFLILFALLTLNILEPIFRFVINAVGFLLSLII